MSDLSKFQELFGEPHKTYNGKIEYRALMDYDNAKDTANRIISEHGLNLKVNISHSLIMTRSFTVETV